MTDQSELAVVRREPEPLATVNISALIEKAIDAKSAVEVMERLQAMRRELKAEQAKEAFDLAMAEFQSECPIIIKRKGGANGTKYAPIEDILESKTADGETVRGLLRRHGFSYTASSDNSKERHVKAIVTIKHRAGHKEISQFEVPIDGRNKMANDPQLAGGAMTYALRYAFKNGFGILTADEDLDGRVNRPKPQGPSSVEPEDPKRKAFARQLWEILKAVRGAKKDWGEANAWMWKNNILSDGLESPHLTVDQFSECITKSKIVLGVA